MTHTHLSSLTDKELLLALQFDDNPQVSELVKRLEQSITDQETELTEKEDELINWAVGCFTEHAGEGHHSEVITRLHETLRLNKPDMKVEIKGVIQTLEEMDVSACNEVAAMQSGDAF